MIKVSKTEYLAQYAEHLKSLNRDDRYTRFGYTATPENIDSLILNILYNIEHHHIFTHVEDDKIVGFGHLAKLETDWELAVSVESDYQGRGIANALMSYMIKWGQTHGIRVVYMHCITDNKKIQHLAAKHGLRAVERNNADITSKIELPQPTVMDYTTNLLQEQNELAIDIVKLQRAWMKKWFQPVMQ
jgi:GNAT superfamily N-acetyltransferase